MARRDLSSRDASYDASAELEYIIRSKSPAQEKKISVQEAMSQEPVFKQQSDRDVTRVLFISRNEQLLNPAKQTLDGFLKLSELFDEVHILVLREGIPAKNPSLRVAKNVWVYTVSAHFWWQTPKLALELLEDQLVFANGFRADLVVARDAFESAYVARKIADKYHRPKQLHIVEDFHSTSFLKRAKNNFWRRLFLPLTIPYFPSIRTTTESVLTYVKTKYEPVDIQVLPKFHDYEALITADQTINLAKAYQPHIVFLLYCAVLDRHSLLLQALKAARFVLQNPRVGMLVLGEGESQREFKRGAKVLGIAEQVVFEHKAPSVVPYLKSAHILIITETDSASDDLVMKGAAAGIPMVMAETPNRADIFINGVSAYMCDVENTELFTQYIDELLNKPALRHKFVQNTQQIIRQRFHTNPSAYREAYRESIEGAFFVDIPTDDETAD